MGSDPSEFHECEFWDRFYATCGGKPFEWYGSWSDVAGLVLAVTERAEPLLVLGCGKCALLLLLRMLLLLLLLPLLACLPARPPARLRLYRCLMLTAWLYSGARVAIQLHAE